jgi:hypothetical protein
VAGFPTRAARAARAAVGTIALLCLAGPGAAQSGASWAVGDTAIMTIAFGGIDMSTPVPMDMPTEDMARLFKTMCLDTGGDPAAMAAAAERDLPGLRSAPVTVKDGKKEPYVEIRLWRGPGVVVAQTDGFRSVPQAQCSATFYPVTMPNRAALTDALAAAIGALPGNAAEATKRNGKPDKSYVPLWTVAQGSNPARTVNAISMKAAQHTPISTILIAVRDGQGATR